MTVGHIGGAPAQPVPMKSTLISIFRRGFFAFRFSLLFAFAPGLALGASAVRVMPSYHHDVPPPLREMAAHDRPDPHQEREAAANPKIPNNHVDSPDPLVGQGASLRLLAPRIPAPLLDFDGIVFPGVGCNCAPPTRTARSVARNSSRL